MTEQTSWLTILGSTGSIGVSTLDVVERHPERYRVFALTARSNVVSMCKQVLKHQPKFAVMTDVAAADLLRSRLAHQRSKTEVLAGSEALEEVVAAADVDIVMAAIVGAAGLTPTLAAVKAGKRILLANKEALVMTGDLFMQAVREFSAVLLPIDSEHNAIYQCLPNQLTGNKEQLGVTRIVLTASGGPFRQVSIESLENVTPEQACAHPNWDMGAKISVDSATMMNKGLELIEACWLFETKQDKVDILLHPQSIVHSLVEYLDGSLLAQLGNPDMRTPIAYGLSWPERIESGAQRLDLATIGKLEFEELDQLRFPCVSLAEGALAAGGTACTALNAANEIAVQAFLGNKIRFTEIAETVDRVMQRYEVKPAKTIADVLDEDSVARRLAASILGTAVDARTIAV